MARPADFSFSNEKRHRGQELSVVILSFSFIAFHPKRVRRRIKGGNKHS